MNNPLINKTVKWLLDRYVLLSDAAQLLVTIPVLVVLLFGTGMLITRGCAYINGVPQKFTAQESFIAALGSPAGSHEVSRSEVKGGTDRSYLYVGYQSNDSYENVLNFYDHALLSRGWKKLSPGASDEKRWCKKYDLFIVRPREPDAAEKGYTVSIKWHFGERKPMECYTDLYGIGEDYE